jgi:hypothetical protein
VARMGKLGRLAMRNICLFIGLFNDALPRAEV